MTPEEYLNSINIDRELKMLARCNKHTSRNNNAIYKTYCLDLGEFEKENNMSNSSIIKSCDNCKYADRPGYAWPCTDCLVHNKWEKRNIPQSNKKQNIVIPAIKDVIFNPPATIIIWEDHTKTVVKCGENDIYDPEKGMAMAISRKALGDRGSYYNVFEKWLEKCDIDLVPAKTKFVMMPDKMEFTCEGMINTDVLAKLTGGDGGHSSIVIEQPTDNVKIVNTGTGAVTKSDICEYDHKEKDVDKQCSNCKYTDCDGNDYPCSACYGPKSTIDICNKWEPKESDN